MNFGPTGTRVTVGIPGSGVSYTSKLTGADKPTPVAASGSSIGCFGWFLIVVVGLTALTLAIDFAKTQPVAAAMAAALIGAIVVLYLRSEKQAKEARIAEAAKARTAYLQRLADTYGADNVDLLLAGRPWLGATAAMVNEMLGAPAATDEKIYKTKVSRTYKYESLGGNRFRFRVFLENDVVVGWEDKAE